MAQRQQHSAPSQRQLRMGEELRHALAEVLARGDLHDPALRDRTITVTEVRVSPDLRNATVYVTPLGGGDMDEVVQGLRRARGFFRAQMARMVEARFVPDLSFQADESFENARRIGELLRQSEPAGQSGDDDAQT